MIIFQTTGNRLSVTFSGILELFFRPALFWFVGKVLSYQSFNFAWRIDTVSRFSSRPSWHFLVLIDSCLH